MNNSDAIKIEIPSGLEFVCDQLKEFHRLKQKEREEAAWRLWNCFFTTGNENGKHRFDGVLRQYINEADVKEAWNYLFEVL